MGKWVGMSTLRHVPTTQPVSDHAAKRRADQAAPAVARTVLAVGTDDWAIEQSASTLEVAGHTVLRCHQPGEPAFPCNAFRADRVCPLDVGIDAVVTSRARPVDAPTAAETGVTCALRAGVPLIVNGMSRNSPFGDLAARVVDQGGDLAEAVEQTATRPSVIELGAQPSRSNQ